MGDFNFNQGLIARRLFVQVIFLSLLATAVISALQIHVRYGDKLKSIENELQRIETSHQSSLTANLWNMDEALVRTELQGILNLPNIQFVEVRSAGGQRITLGTPGSGDHITRQHPLVFSHRGVPTELGSLTIHADLKPIRSELWTDAVALSVGEAGKIFITALLVFFLFQFTVGRHLRNLARQASDLDLGRPQSPFHLHRPPRKGESADELGYLSSSLNRLYANLKATIESLRHTNEKLDQEIEERKKAEAALRESEKKYQSLFDHAQVALFRTSISDGKLLELNQRYAQMAGYSNTEDCMAEFNAADAWTNPEARIDLRRILLAKGFVTDFETEIVRRDGTHIWILFSATIFPEPGYFEGSIVDITERKQAEAALRSSLAEKESLLKEVHHRVKNNLQIISSLLNLQGRKTKSPEALGFLQDTQNRVRSMALLHETLYQSSNLAKVDFPRYVRSICTHLARSCADDAIGIRLRQDIADVALDMDQAIPAGLIISELVTNAFKHAFPTRTEGEISVELQASGEQHLVLRVSDNGVGFPAETRSQSSETLGLILVRNLSRQLDGQLSITGEQGSVFEIVFPAQAI